VHRHGSNFTCECRSPLVDNSTSTGRDKLRRRQRWRVRDRSAQLRPAGLCSNTVDNFTCERGAGYTLQSDGATCADEDECQEDTHNCNALATCSNPDGSFTCKCSGGYMGTGTDGMCTASVANRCLAVGRCSTLSCTSTLAMSSSAFESVRAEYVDAVAWNRVWGVRACTVSRRSG